MDTRRIMILAATLLVVVSLPAVVALPGSTASAQSEGGDAAVLLVLDVSGSMAREGADGTVLLDAAREAVDGYVAGIPDGVDYGLRAYGHRVGNDESDKPEGCRDTELLVPVGEGTPASITAAMEPLEPSGWTPIGLALRRAARDLQGVERATVVLVSDGEDTCGNPPPCQAARALANRDIDVVIDTVGLLLDTDAAERQLSCVAEATGGEFVTADDAASLSDALEASQTRAARRYQVTGQPLPGAPIPFEAPTAEPGVQYVDEVRGDEVLFWAIGGMGPGDTFDVEMVREAVPGASGGMFTDYFGVDAYVVDGDDNRFGPNDCCSNTDLAEPEIIALRGVVVPDDVQQAYLKITTEAQSVPVEDLQGIQFRIVPTTPAEPSPTPTPSPTSAPSPTPTPTAPPTPTPTPTPSPSPTAVPSTPAGPTATAAPTTAATDAGGSGLPGWAIVLIGLLVVAVVGLAGWIVVLQRRIGPATAPPTPPSTDPPPPPSTGPPTGPPTPPSSRG